MRAEPVAEALATVRTSLERLREARRPTVETEPWAIADTVVGRLSAVAETVGDAERLPRLSHTPDTAADRGVVAVLDRHYEGGSVAELVDTEPTATAVAAGRLHDGADPVVPLSVPANWYVLLPWTASRLRELGEELELLARRLSAVAAPPLADTYTDLSRAATDLATVTEWLPTLALWYAPPEELVDADYHEVESFARHTLEATKET